MFLKSRNNGNMVDVSQMRELTNLYHDTVQGCYQSGEEMQDLQAFDKSELIFLSGEDLPKCWTDPHYRIHK